MASLTGLEALGFNQLPDINEVEPLSLDDQACLDEIRDVLQRHNRVSKFGIILLHNHFELAQDEIMVERIDSKNRTLLTRPVKVTTINTTKLVETIWRFDRFAAQACEAFCPTDTEGGHYGYKDHYPGDDNDDDDDSDDDKK